MNTDNSKNKGQLLQDPFLNILRREHVPVSIYLVNGIKLQGQIESFDQYVVLLRNTVTQMVYKHAISTIVPGRKPLVGLKKKGCLSPFFMCWRHHLLFETDVYSQPCMSGPSLTAIDPKPFFF
ncbi:MAG: hypothetical protein RIR68_3280 [Pseudomonadota bacterium]